jgi:DNA processing protein
VSSLQETDAQTAPAACPSCLRRGWLLGELSGPLDYCARDRPRLLELLALGDQQLLDAVAGRRGGELRERYAHFTPQLQRQPSQGAQTVCRHTLGYPSLLCGAGVPRMLEVAGGAHRLHRLSTRPVVAIIGSTRASDYGVEMARSIARELAASGVTVVAGMLDGIAVAAHHGALDAAGGASIALLGGGLGVSCPARRRALFGRVTRSGCVLSELPHLASGRRWAGIAAERIVVGVASLALLIEAEDTDAALFAAHIARALGRGLAAIPGRVTSPLSRGPHRLLMEGANLVRTAEDVLELLYPPGVPERRPRSAPEERMSEPAPALRNDLRVILDHVGSGCDTPDRLVRAGLDPGDLLLGLSELEIFGLLARGDGGRYVLRHPFRSDG